MPPQTDLNFDLGIDNVPGHVRSTKKLLVSDLLRKKARTIPDTVALVGEDETERRTYGELDDRVNQLANGLLARGVDHGSSLAILAENRIEYAELIYASAKIGALVPTINWRQEREELIHCLGLVESDTIVISEKMAEKKAWIDESDLSLEVVALDGGDWGVDYESIIADGATTEPEPTREPSPEDGVTVFYTSGTTGLPKGAIVSHRAMINRAIGWKWVSGMGPDAVGWSPMFHLAGTEPLFLVCMEGGTFHIFDGFDIGPVVERLSETDSGYFPVTPGVIKPLLEYADKHDITADAFESVECIGALPDLVAANQLQAVTELFDADYLNLFGSTEAGGTVVGGNTILAGTRPTKEDLSKSEGPLADIKLVDSEWNEVPQGTKGELAVRGPPVFSGYIGNKEANETEFHEGWFRTGDMMRKNEDGKYDFVDRRKYLIKSGGENIYPAEIERALLDLPEVSEAIAVSISDDKWGEVPKAYVVIEPDASVTRTELLERIEGKMARYKLPHFIEFVDENQFPRNISGKIVRSEVEDWAVDEEQRVRDP